MLLRDLMLQTNKSVKTKSTNLMD